MPHDDGWDDFDDPWYVKLGICMAAGVVIAAVLLAWWLGVLALLRWVV